MGFQFPQIFSFLVNRLVYINRDNYFQNDQTPKTSQRILNNFIIELKPDLKLIDYLMNLVHIRAIIKETDLTNSIFERFRPMLNGFFLRNQP